MPIKVVNLKSGGPTPRFYCDQCGEHICPVFDGNFMWPDEEGGEVKFTHKMCCHAFDLANHGYAADELKYFLKSVR